MPRAPPVFRLQPETADEELDQLAAALAASLTLDERVPEPEAEDSPRPSCEAAAGSADAAPAAPPPQLAEEAPPAPTPEPEASAAAAALGLWRPREIGRAAHPFTRNHRFYAVWRLSAVGGGTTWAGVHIGLSTDAYAGLLSLNGGHFGGIAFHRENDLESACQSWWREAPKHKLAKGGLSVQGCRVYFWDPRPSPPQ